MYICDKFFLSSDPLLFFSKNNGQKHQLNFIFTTNLSKGTAADCESSIRIFYCYSFDIILYNNSYVFLVLGRKNRNF